MNSKKDDVGQCAKLGREEKIKIIKEQVGITTRVGYIPYTDEYNYVCMLGGLLNWIRINYKNLFEGNSLLYVLNNTNFKVAVNSRTNLDRELEAQSDQCIDNIYLLIENKGNHI